MPLGVQLVGAAGDDARLLRTARWLVGEAGKGSRGRAKKLTPCRVIDRRPHVLAGAPSCSLKNAMLRLQARSAAGLS